MGRVITTMEQSPIITSQPPIQDGVAPSERWQFSISSPLWLMITAGLCLGYARLFGTPEVIYMAVVPLIGALIEFVFRRPYWGGMGAMMACLTVIGAQNGSVVEIWPLLGASCAIYSSIRKDDQTIPTVLRCGLVAFLFLFWLHRPFGMGTDGWMNDPLIGAIIAIVFSGLVRHVERSRDYGISRPILSAGILFAVIAVNLAVAALGGRLFQ
jgi:hypothetical protein